MRRFAMRQPLATEASRSSVSYNDVGADVGPISYPRPTDPGEAGPGTLHLSRWLATASCMDLRQQSRHEHYRERLHHYNSGSSHLPQSESKLARPASYTGPLTRNQWTDVPLPYRPRDWQDVKDEPLPVARQEPHRWRLRSSMNENNSKPAQSRGRHRPGAFRSVTAREYPQSQRADADPALLYPQMSPYDDAQSSYSAPDELSLAPRAVSQPSSASHWQTSFYMSDTEDDLPLTMLPRTPTYPPSGGRRARGAASNVEATFTDEEEFHLFVQATAGLGPEQAFRSPTSPEESPRRSRATGARPFSTPQAPVSTDLVSPIQETPTTMHALRQLAQMPHDPRRPAPVRLDAGQSFAAQRLDTAMGGIDLWLQPPSAVSEEDDVVSPIDNELPDYAASQAQAQAAQRAEATRRAQELQRRWQLRSG